MVGAGIVMGFDSRDHIVQAAPSHHAVYQTVAALRYIFFGEAVPTEVVHVVGQVHVEGHARAGHLAGFRGVGFQDDFLLWCQQCVWAHDLTGIGSVLWGHEIRVRSVGLGGCQLQHLRAEGCQQQGRFLGRLHRHILRRAHLLQILHHLRIRLGVGKLMHALHERGVAHADAQHEAVVVSFCQSFLPCHCCHRVSCRHLADAGGDF